jgi:hypothetical protein
MSRSVAFMTRISRCTVLISTVVAFLLVAVWIRGMYKEDQFVRGFVIDHPNGVEWGKKWLFLGEGNFEVQFIHSRHIGRTARAHFLFPPVIPGLQWTSREPVRRSEIPFAWKSSSDRVVVGSGAESVTLQSESLKVRCPYWCALLISLMLPATALFRYLLARRKAKLGYCSECGYDLRGTPDRCPECGTKCDRPGEGLADQPFR